MEAEDWKALEEAELTNDFVKVVEEALLIVYRVGCFATTERLLRERGLRLHLVAKNLRSERPLLLADRSEAKGKVSVVFSTTLDAEKEQLDAQGTKERNLEALEGAGIEVTEGPERLIENEDLDIRCEGVDMRCENEDSWNKIVSAIGRDMAKNGKRNYVVHFEKDVFSPRLEKVARDIDALNAQGRVSICVDP